VQTNPDGVKNLTQRFPDAMVIVAATLDDFLGGLRRVRPDVFVGNPMPFGARLLVVIDERGVGLHRDGYRAGIVVQFDWSQIEWAGVDPDNFTTLRSQGTPMPVLVLDVIVAGQRVPLPFYLMPQGLGRILDYPLDERAMRPIVDRVRELGGSGKPRAIDATPVRTRWTVVAPTAQSVLRVAVVTGMVMVVAVLVFLGVTGNWRASVPTVVIPGFFVVALMSYVLRYVSRLEARRGYTTLNGTFAFADQVDPKTGVVIRRAGEAMLSADERRERTSAARRE